LLCERVGSTGGMKSIFHFAIVYLEAYVHSTIADTGDICLVEQAEQCPGAVFLNTPG